MRTIILTIVSAGAALAAGCMANRGPPAQMAAGARQCFNAAQVNSFQAVDRDTVYVTTGVRRMYQLEVVGVCPEIDWTQRIGLRSTSGSNWVCSGLDAELLVPSPTGLQRCPVVGVRALTPPEIEAYRARRR
jgi:hypothetical protein